MEGESRASMPSEISSRVSFVILPPLRQSNVMDRGEGRFCSPLSFVALNLKRRGGDTGMWMWDVGEGAAVDLNPATWTPTASYTCPSFCHSNF